MFPKRERSDNEGVGGKSAQNTPGFDGEDRICVIADKRVNLPREFSFTKEEKTEVEKSKRQNVDDSDSLILQLPRRFKAL